MAMSEDLVLGVYVLGGDAGAKDDVHGPCLVFQSSSRRQPRMNFHDDCTVYINPRRTSPRSIGRIKDEAFGQLELNLLRVDVFFEVQRRAIVSITQISGPRIEPLG